MSRRMARSLVLILSVVLTVMLTEFGLRLLVDETRWARPFSPGPWTWVVTDPVLGWANRPGVSSPAFQINSLGFRGPELPVEKPPGGIRVACLGDSSTFGVRQDGPASLAFDSYVEILRERLAASGRQDVEVINAGVLGYSSSNGLRQLATRIRDLAPDVVVARFGFNDYAKAYEPQLQVVEPDSWLQRTLLYAFADWKLLRLSLLALRNRPSDVGPFRIRWVEPERFERNLHRLAELAADEGFELLLMDYPLRRVERGETPGSPIGAYPQYGVGSIAELHELHGSYQEILRRTASQAGIPLLQTAPACRLPGDPCFGDFDLAHPSRFGAELHARLLHEQLVERGWLAREAGTDR
jgi:lysophospholipase L1-like esterase